MFLLRRCWNGGVLHARYEFIHKTVLNFLNCQNVGKDARASAYRRTDCGSRSDNPGVARFREAPKASQGSRERTQSGPPNELGASVSGKGLQLILNLLVGLVHTGLRRRRNGRCGLLGAAAGIAAWLESETRYQDEAVHYRQENRKHRYLFTLR